MNGYLRLGINIDHVATIRNARGGFHPDPVRAACMAVTAGADSIVVHLREDRRHISDSDLVRLTEVIQKPITLEMAATNEMLDIALRHSPDTVCIVPENRLERTTEGGLDVISKINQLSNIVKSLREKDIKVSLFVEPNIYQIEAAHSIAATAVELHTGAYCDSVTCHDERKSERLLKRINEAADHGSKLNLEVHAGHGITYESVIEIASIRSIVELNIGHFIIGESIFTGLEKSINYMRSLIKTSRENPRI